MTKWLQSKALSTFLLLILTKYFRDIKCKGAAISDVTYEEVVLLKAACKESRYICDTLTDFKLWLDFNCNCGSACSFLETCCVDSQYRYNESKLPENAFCEEYYDKKYFYLMIRSCDPDLESDETTVELCNSEGEDFNDPFLKIPVIDPITGISYKNYYCYACNANYSKEEPVSWDLQIESYANYSKEEPVQWDLQVESYDKEVTKFFDYIRYDNRNLKWVTNNGEEVVLNVYVPNHLKIKVFQQHCNKSKIISGCASDWNDYENILSKCSTYMALTRIRSETYRNPHCAICNHRSLENMTCYDDSEKPESDLNVEVDRTDFISHKLNKIKSNVEDCKDNMVYDTFTQKCRRVFRTKSRIFFVGWFSFKPCGENMVYDAFSNKCRRVFRSKGKVQ